MIEERYAEVISDPRRVREVAALCFWILVLCQMPSEELSIEAETEDIGTWRASCPICVEEIRGLTFFGCEKAVVAHLNKAHNKRGH